MTTDARPMAMTLLRGAEVYAPEPLGVCDVLVVGERVARVAADLGAFAGLDEVEVRDVRGLSMVPGFIDQHVHVTGGGGGGGFVTRGPEAMLTDLTRWGITTVVGIQIHEPVIVTMAAADRRTPRTEFSGLAPAAHDAEHDRPAPGRSSSTANVVPRCRDVDWGRRRSTLWSERH